MSGAWTTLLESTAGAAWSHTTWAGTQRAKVTTKESMATERRIGREEKEGLGIKRKVRQARDQERDSREKQREKEARREREEKTREERASRY